ncbi:gem-associated protein 8 [Callorhinchus milii]|uniref:gem-associated protein 8 n=1 Tax=Callorhinchus milii TaxID=7868 RepID=UPI001C3F83B1|nr:gem-associated protein 8 [Callorhinchus milii]
MDPNRGTEGEEVTRPREMWYSHKMYSRYWQHYQQAMLWLQKHRRAYRKAVESLQYPAWSSPELGACRLTDWHEDAAHRARYGQGQQWRRPHGSKRQEENFQDETDPYSDMDEESESEIECDVSGVEITEELRQYFEQTEKHREELKRQQEYDDEQQKMYVLADHDFHSTMGRTVQPPAERPGERRVVEMKRLYGESAAKIQGMETAMQLTFDRKCDKKQPKYWPVIPLKL